MGQLAFRVAPTGKRVGLCVGSDLERSAVVVVLPKTWRTRHTKLIRCPWPQHGHLFISAYEGDTVVVEGTRNQTDALNSWLLEMQSDDSDLISLTVLPSSGGAHVAPDTAETAIQPILDLLELFDRANFDMVEESIPHARDRHELMRLVLYRRFVAELEPLITRLRPQYRATEEVLQAPRGRIIDRSLVETIASRRPDVLCRFDEHSRSTDLAAVLLAALRMIAKYAGTARTSSLFEALRIRAARLVRQLEGVTVVDRRVAFRLSRGIRLTRLEREFALALHFARSVLRDELPLPTGSPGPTFETFRVSVPTERLWEEILFQALAESPVVGLLRANFSNRAGPGVDVPAPWVKLTSGSVTDRFPDFLAVVEGAGSRTIWCIDAKYKALPGGGAATEDANQLFVYSHVARLGGKHIDTCALVYPTTAQYGVQLELTRERARDLSLSIVGAPFPQPSDLRSDRAWADFIESCSAVLGQCLTGPEAQIA